MPKVIFVDVALDSPGGRNEEFAVFVDVTLDSLGPEKILKSGMISHAFRLLRRGEGALLVRIGSVS